MTQAATQSLVSSLILGSGSPRRKELLTHARIPFEVLVPKVIEKHQSGEAPEDYALRNATEKCHATWKLANGTYPNPIVIAADTIVVIQDKILEKPASPEEACAMLHQLSNATHQVITGVCIQDKTSGKPFAVTTEVTFRQLSNIEITRYVATGEPMDKAGSYAAQGQGACMIRGIVGSYTNVIGLPMAEVIEALSDLGIVSQ